jgi:Rhs element Vgr protein
MPAASPLADATGPVRVVVKCNGSAVTEGVQVLSLTVHRAFNRVPSATLVLADGDMPEQSFPVSDAAHFKPGTEIELLAGWGDGEDTLFKGLVLKHAVRIAGSNDARLIVECRDKAVKLTVGRHTVVSIDQTDADVMQALAGGAGLTASVSGAGLQHKQLVQHHCSDWDFLLARAEANGCVVAVVDGEINIGPPKVSGDAALKVAYGESLIDFEAEVDARLQATAVQARAWDPTALAKVEGSEAQPDALTAQGNLAGSDLAQVLDADTLQLQSGVPLQAEVLAAWAKAQQLKLGLARLRGQMRFSGSAKAVLGGLIELAGVGERFSGTVLASAVEHHIEDGDWSTTVHFGRAAPWFTEQPDIVAPPASGLLPGIEGLHVGLVVKLDADPAGEHRVQVQLPALGVDPMWARLMQAHASNAIGAFFVPEVGDEVVLGFFNHDPNHPVVLGSLYSSKHPPPYALAAENNTKALVTRSKLKLEFDEKDKVITLLTPGANKIVISDKDKSIVLTDQNSNKLELGPGGITLDSPKDIKISAKGTITLDAIGALTLQSKADAKLAGLNVACNAQVGMTAKGTATAELSASGQTTVKGALVMIN